MNHQCKADPAARIMDWLNGHGPDRSYPNGVASIVNTVTMQQLIDGVCCVEIKDRLAARWQIDRIMQHLGWKREAYYRGSRGHIEYLYVRPPAPPPKPQQAVTPPAES